MAQIVNKAAGEMEVTIDGTKYTLRPSFTAVMEFEEKSGKSVFEAMQEFSRRGGRCGRGTALLSRESYGSWVWRPLPPP